MASSADEGRRHIVLVGLDLGREDGIIKLYWLVGDIV
jgi:hypothetical protein